jgi:phosphatidylserine decarboxylase
MSTDPIVEELDRLRAEQMESYRFDFEAFYRDLKEQERLSPQPVQAPQDSPADKRVNSAGRYMTRR